MITQLHLNFFKHNLYKKVQSFLYFFLRHIKINDLKSAVRLSLILHIACVFIFFFHEFFFAKPKPYIPTLKVDLVALPDTLKKDLQTPQKAQLHQEIKEVLKAADQKIKRAKTERELL